MSKTSTGVKKQKKLSKAKLQPTMSEEDKKAYMFYRYRIQKAKEARNQPFRRFDNQTFLDDYYSNEDAVNSYLRPKQNDDEVRVVGGLTENRISSVINEMLSMNWQHEIQAFDQSDLEVEDLGRNMEDMVTRTNQIEKDEDVREEILWELLTQRATFVEEVIEEKWTNDMLVKKARKRLKSALQVFVGDITKPAYLFEEQPYIVEYERTSFWEAAQTYDTDEWKAKFGDQWQYVNPGMSMDSDVFGSDYTFRLGILLNEEVEIIKYKSAPDNEYQIIINGVMMLPVGTKLPWNHPGYNIVCSVTKRMSPHLFYGRPMTAMLKYLQALNDETVRNIIRKFRQAIQPPQTVAASNKIYSKDIWEAGKVTYGIPKDTFTKLVDHNGVTDSELAVYRTIVQLQDEVAGRSSIQGGAQPEKKQTATAAIQQQQAAIKMLGLFILAYSRLLRDLTYLRVYSIIEEFTDVIGKTKDPADGKWVDQHRQFTLKDTVLDNNKRGKKVVNLFHRNLTASEEWDLMKYEDDQEKIGNNIRNTFINAGSLSKVPLMWYVSISSKPKDNDDLHKLMFSDKLNQAQQMITIMPDLHINSGQAANEFEQMWRTKDFFQKPEEAQMQAMQPGMPQMGPDGQPMAPQGQQQPGGEDVRAKAQAMLGKLEGMRSQGALNGIRAGTRRPAAPSKAPVEVLNRA